MLTNHSLKQEFFKLPCQEHEFLTKGPYLVEIVRKDVVYTRIVREQFEWEFVYLIISVFVLLEFYLNKNHITDYFYRYIKGVNKLMSEFYILFILVLYYFMCLFLKRKRIIATLSFLNFESVI